MYIKHFLIHNIDRCVILELNLQWCVSCGILNYLISYLYLYVGILKVYMKFILVYEYIEVPRGYGIFHHILFWIFNLYFTNNNRWRFLCIGKWYNDWLKYVLYLILIFNYFLVIVCFRYVKYNSRWRS